jgi:23S rRNA pseudouridine2604 synthase
MLCRIALQVRLMPSTHRPDTLQLRMVLMEGMKRQIRQMCLAVGFEVLWLRRVRVGHLNLGDLPQGMWRMVEKGEL